MAFQLSTEYEALKHDVNTLFSRFYEKQSVRFEDFCSEWKAMNFTCIFAATFRNTSTAKMRIVERLFRVSSEFLSEESTFLYRVAAVYMFYSVYFKQISEQKVKIRMTPTMWKDLMEFFNIVTEHRHLDASYVIHILIRNKAFVFTAFPKQLMFGRHEFMIGIEGMTGLRHTYQADKYINDLLQGNDCIESLNKVQDEYDEVKQKLLNESKEEEKPFLSKVLFLSNSEFPDDFKQMIATHKVQRRPGKILKHEPLDSSQRPVFTQLTELKGNNKESITDNVETSSSTRAHFIYKLKEKSWKSAVSVSPSKRKKKKEENNDEAEENVEDLELVYYKKSAMLEPFKVKSLKRTVNSVGLRYKT